jgi:hypothetical protein
MKLLTKANRNALPLLYTHKGNVGEALAQVKFFAPDSQWTWYASEAIGYIDYDNGDQKVFPLSETTEYQGELYHNDHLVTDVRFSGLVIGQVIEYGQWLWSELLKNHGPLGLPVERDKWFKPVTLAEIRLNPARY